MNNAKHLEQFINRFYVSQHYEDWHPRFFEKYDVDELIKKVDKLKPDAFYATARTHNGKWFCDIGWGPLHKGLKGVDQFRKFCDHFKKQGKPVMAYFSTIYDKELYDEHPDWRQVDKHGTPLGLTSGSWGKFVCPNSPYREYLIGMARSLVDTYDIDGVYFDMIFYNMRPCYCPYCRKEFKAQYGADIPEEENWDDPVFRKFMQFRMDTNYTFVRDICRAVKSKNEKLSICGQYTILKPHPICGHSIKIGEEIDYIYSDVYFGSGYLPMSVITRLSKAISRYRPELGIMTRPGSHTDTPNMKSIDHLRAEAFTVISNGGAIMFFDIMWPDGTVQDAMYDRVRIVHEEVNERKPWIGGEAVKSVAVFYSEATRLWYGRDNFEERYDANFMGMCKALIEDHVHFNMLVRLTDETLSGYKVLVLPNAVCLSEEEVAAVERFVKKGGGLVATEKTSLWDERGEPLRDYRLAEVFGFSHAGDTSAYTRVFSGFDMAQPVSRRLHQDGLVTSWGAVQKVDLKGAKALAQIVYPFAEPTGEKFVNIMANPPAVRSDWAACTVNNYGDGKAIYFAGGIDRDYGHLSFPEYKWLIADAVRQAAKEPLGIELSAPSSVELAAWRKDGKLIVHLTNFQAEIGKTIITTTGKETRHLINEILPVYELKLTIRGKAPKTATLQPGNTALEVKSADGGYTVTVPKLECHGMVVIDD